MLYVISSDDQLHQNQRLGHHSNSINDSENQN